MELGNVTVKKLQRASALQIDWDKLATNTVQVEMASACITMKCEHCLEMKLERFSKMKFSKSQSKVPFYGKCFIYLFSQCGVPPLEESHLAKRSEFQTAPVPSSGAQPKLPADPRVSQREGPSAPPGTLMAMGPPLGSTSPQQHLALGRWWTQHAPAVVARRLLRQSFMSMPAFRYSHQQPAVTEHRDASGKVQRGCRWENNAHAPIHVRFLFRGKVLVQNKEILGEAAALWSLQSWP